MRPATKNINIDEGDDTGRVILSVLILTAFCVLALVRGCA